MRSSLARTRLLLVAVPTILAGCFGSRRQTSAGPVVRPESAGVVQKTDSTKKVTEPPKAMDSATFARLAAATADSIAKANRPNKAAFDSAAKKDSAKSTKSKAPASKPCLMDFSESPSENRTSFLKLPDGTGLMFVGGGFVGHCQGETSRIQADSAEHFEASGILNLFGNVTYTDPGKVMLAAQHATYFRREERLIADGNVVATQLASGSTFRGSSIEYLRPMLPSRPFSKLIAPNRPTLQMIEKDSVGNPTPPVNVIANTIIDDADSLLFAWGDVQITRTTLVGNSDSASFDKVTERARLIRSARVVNNDQKQPFRMSGDTIDMYSKERKLERVVALHDGNATSNDVVMQAERIDLRFVKQELDMAYAFGPGRARATTSSQLLVADSIAVRMPEQRVRTVMAFGRAVATGAPDTTKIKSEDRDVLRGDTVRAWFDSTALPSDTSKRSKLTEIHALGTASSLFQIANKAGPKAPAALNYVRGKAIHILFDSGAVRDVLVDSAASGLYLEPVPDSLSDSTKGKRPAPAKSKVPPAPPGKRPPTGKPDAALAPDSRRRQ